MADFILDVASGAVISPKLDPEQAQAHLIECSERCAPQECSRLSIAWARTLYRTSKFAEHAIVRAVGLRMLHQVCMHATPTCDLKLWVWSTLHRHKHSHAFSRSSLLLIVL